MFVGLFSFQSCNLMYLLFHEVFRIRMGWRPHCRIGMVTKVAFSGSGFTFYFRTWKYQWGSTIRLQQRKYTVKARHNNRKDIEHNNKNSQIV